MSKDAPEVRYAEVERETTLSRVRVVLDLDGGTRRDISTGLGFLDHMLDRMAACGFFDLGISAEGDLGVDDHHLVEDVGVALGKAMRECLVETPPIVRYASQHMPEDEALVLVALDVSGRGHLTFQAHFQSEKIGGLSTQNIEPFFWALSRNAGLTLHIHALSGTNDHHLCEAIFKGFGQAFYLATRRIESKRNSAR